MRDLTALIHSTIFIVLCDIREPHVNCHEEKVILALGFDGQIAAAARAQVHLPHPACLIYTFRAPPDCTWVMAFYESYICVSLDIGAIIGLFHDA